MYFHRAGWPGDWIAAVRKLLWNEFDQSYHFREDVAWPGGNETGSTVCSWPFYLFLYWLYHRVPHWPSPRICSITYLHIAFLSIPSMKWATICALNLKMSQTTTFWCGGTNTIATIHACIGWPLTIIAYPVSDSRSFGFLAYNILQQVLVLAWSMYSAKVTSSYCMCVTTSPPNPHMRLYVLEIGAHVNL